MTEPPAALRVLIVERCKELGQTWAGLIRQPGHQVVLTANQDEAIAALEAGRFDVLVLDFVLGDGSAFAVADVAAFRHPDAQVIFVTDTTFFSDGSIFRHLPNVAAFLPSSAPPEDIAAVVDHYGARATASGPRAAAK